MAILCHFSSKNDLKMTEFRPFFMQKWHKITTFQIFVKRLLNFVLHGVVILCKFELIRTKIKGANMFGAEYFRMFIVWSFLCVKTDQWNSSISLDQNASPATLFNAQAYIRIVRGTNWPPRLSAQIAWNSHHDCHQQFITKIQKPKIPIYNIFYLQ